MHHFSLVFIRFSFLKMWISCVRDVTVNIVSLKTKKEYLKNVGIV